VTTPNVSDFKLSKTVKQLIIWGAAALVVIIAAVSIFSFVNGTRDEGIRKTSALEAQYLDNQNELSTYILKFNESLGIADRQNAKLNEILLDAVKGRYDNDGSLQPGTGGQLFSAITEAYPDLSANSESYMKVQDLIVSGRDAYKNKQTKLLDMVRDYEVWLQSDYVKSSVIKNLGFPGDYLSVKVDGKTLTGQNALDQIASIVLTEDAQEAYETGTIDPLITPTDD
jgi:hypothetical protein